MEIGKGGGRSGDSKKGKILELPIWRDLKFFKGASEVSNDLSKNHSNKNGRGQLAPQQSNM